SSTGSSAGASQTPTGSRRARKSARRPFQAASGTAMGPAGRISGTLSSAATPRKRHSSGSTRAGPPAMWITRSGSTGELLAAAIDACLERRETDAMHGVHETLVGVARVEVSIDQALDHVGHFGRGERGPDHFAQRRFAALAAAYRDLVPLGPVLVDAEDADMADVMVAAGVHAAGDVEVELADVVQV